MRLLLPYKIRLAINEVWNTVPGAFCMFGICCNSFCKMQPGCIYLHGARVKYSYQNICFILAFLRSSYTSGRDIFNDYAGNCGYDFVKIGNCLASRLILLLIICSVRGCRWLVEQPEGSSLASTRRFQEFLGLTKVSLLHLHVKYVHLKLCIIFPSLLHLCDFLASAHPEARCSPHRSGWERFRAKHQNGIVYGATTNTCWMRSSALVAI